MKRLGGHTQCRGRPILDPGCFDRQHFPPADPVVRTESEPGGKLGRAGEAREVRTDLRQKSLRGEDVDPWNTCQVHPEDSIEVILQVETGFATTRFLPVWRFREGTFRRILSIRSSPDAAQFRDHRLRSTLGNDEMLPATGRA